VNKTYFGGRDSFAGGCLRWRNDERDDLFPSVDLSPGCGPPVHRFCNLILCRNDPWHTWPAEIQDYDECRVAEERSHPLHVGRETECRMAAAPEYEDEKCRKDQDHVPDQPRFPGNNDIHPGQDMPTGNTARQGRVRSRQ